MIKLYRDGELIARYTPTNVYLKDNKLCIILPPGYIELVTEDEIRFDPAEVILWIKRKQGLPT